MVVAGKGCAVERLRPRNVLLVGPDERLREFLSYFFRVHGWAASGPCASQGRPEAPGAEWDLVVVEETTPFGEGLDIIRAMRERGSLVPALLVTHAPVSEALALQAVHLFNVVVLDDPYCLERLSASCSALLSREVPRKQGA